MRPLRRAWEVCQWWTTCNATDAAFLALWIALAVLNRNEPLFLGANVMGAFWAASNIIPNLTSARWMVDFTPPASNLEHRHYCMDWESAPRPPVLHRCRPWTRGTCPTRFDYIERCACGARRINGDPWEGRNTRKENRRG